MPKVSGNDISIYQGETLPIEVTVYDSSGDPCTNLSIAKFALMHGPTVTTYDCAINGAIVSITLTQAQTLLLSGTYTYEFRAKDTFGEVDSMVIGNLTVKTTAPIKIAI